MREKKQKNRSFSALYYNLHDVLNINRLCMVLDPPQVNQV